jgi:hypothetical protein
MKALITIAIVLCTQAIFAEDEYAIDYKTGISIEYGRSRLNGFQGDPVLVVSEQALIDPVIFDLSLLATGDREILKGHPGIGLGAVQFGFRGSLIRLGFLRLSIGIAGGGVLLKEIEEDREGIAIGGIVTGVHEMSLNFSRIRFNGRFAITKTDFNHQSRKELLKEISHPGAGIFFTGGFVLVIDK